MKLYHIEYKMIYFAINYTRTGIILMAEHSCGSLFSSERGCGAYFNYLLTPDT